MNPTATRILMVLAGVITSEERVVTALAEKL